MASRRKGRILAFQALFSWEAQGRSGEAIVPKELLDFSWTNSDTQASGGEGASPQTEEETAFSRLLLTGTVGNIAAVDAMIQGHLDNWELGRLNKVDLAILRISVYTLMFQGDVPSTVVIDEAIEISKEFGTDDSYRFVNGVLDGIRKTLAPAPGQIGR